MKVGLRRPSFRKSLSARTSGRLNRKIKKAFIPYYGKKGTGKYKNPRKAIYNWGYNKSTFSIFDLTKGNKRAKQRKQYIPTKNYEDMDIIEKIEYYIYLLKVGCFAFLYVLGLIGFIYFIIKFIFS